VPSGTVGAVVNLVDQTEPPDTSTLLLDFYSFVHDVAGQHRHWRNIVALGQPLLTNVIARYPCDIRATTVFRLLIITEPSMLHPVGRTTLPATERVVEAINQPGVTRVILCLLAKRLPESALVRECM